MSDVVTIRPAQRARARTLTVFAGVSGSGKTRSAIHYAYGLANFQASKVGLLDTENGRGELYDRVLEEDERKTSERFLYGRLAAPFAPSRYVSAIKQFEAAGVEVLIVDSGTHEWEGEGGCDDIANAPDAAGKPPRMPRWNQAKREHKRFMHQLLQSDMHVVLCLRAREKSKPATDDKGKTIYVSQGVQPACEKNTMFEATISLLMHDEPARREHGFYQRTKVPGDLLRLFPGDRYLTSATGYAVRQWVAGGGDVDPKVERWRNRLLAVTEEGERHIEEAWAKVQPDMQAALGGEKFFSELAAAAREYDRQRRMREEPESAADINREASQRATDQKAEGLPLNW